MYNSFTPIFGIPLLDRYQNNKETTINEALFRIEIILSRTVLAFINEALPISPINGDCYIITKQFDKFEADSIIYYLNGWRVIKPTTAMRVYNKQDNKEYIYNNNWKVVI